jgi:hypothetical protein
MWKMNKYIIFTMGFLSGAILCLTVLDIYLKQQIDNRVPIDVTEIDQAEIYRRWWRQEFERGYIDD